MQSLRYMLNYYVLVGDPFLNHYLHYIKPYYIL
jgi:hypothetical protein